MAKETIPKQKEGGKLLEKGNNEKNKLILSENRENTIQCFRENVFKCMDFYDLKIKDLAQKADMPYGTLNTFLYGRSNSCNLSTAVKLSKALGISIDDLAGCGTRNSTERESIALFHDLPKAEQDVIRWLIRDIHKQYEYCPTGKTIRVMIPKCASGSLMRTMEWQQFPIDHLPSDIQPKVFMGFQVPCVHYMPVYGSGDILIIANDRMPINGEHCVLKASENLYIARCQRVGASIEYMSILGHAVKAVDSDASLVGYVAYIEKSS